MSILSSIFNSRRFRLSAALDLSPPKCVKNLISAVALNEAFTVIKMCDSAHLFERHNSIDNSKVV